MQTQLINKNYKNIISYCHKQAINITEQQLLVLQIICHSNVAIAAHEILNNLKKVNAKANRMTIHRALDYLNKIGVIHKITFNNTYVPCDHLSTEHNCQILVCTKCNTKIEFNSAKLFSSLKIAGEEHEFLISTPIEIMGLCKSCLN